LALSRFSRAHTTKGPPAWPMTPKIAEHWQKALRVN
jgi:hypothetical protein